MPVLSRFTPLGMLSLSGEPSHAEQIYHSMVSSLGGNYSTEPGSRQDAWCYAWAMGLARAWSAMERAGNQAFPDTLAELLPVMEREYGIVPGTFDTEDERRSVVAARMLAALGGTYGNIVTALQTLLGADFIAYRPTQSSAAVQWPAAAGGQPMALKKPEATRRLITLLTPPTTGLGAAIEVRYAPIDPLPVRDDSGDGYEPFLQVGETLVLEPTNFTLAEAVTVTASRWSGNKFYFTAVITRPHHSGDLGTTMPFPMWLSTIAHSQVVVSATAALDPETRRRIDDLMHRMTRGVSTWDITTTNPNGFQVGNGLIGVTAIGPV